MIVAVVIAEMAGVIGSFFTTPVIPEWYATLVRPELSPPNWVFGPVWTTLFALMGIASYFIWQKGWSKNVVKTALTVYGVQLGLNMLWSIIFFGRQNPGAAFIEIIFLWIMIVVTIVKFGRISRLAAWLLVPYLLWVSFASYLNYAIWVLNS